MLPKSLPTTAVLPFFLCLASCSQAASPVAKKPSNQKPTAKKPVVQPSGASVNPAVAQKSVFFGDDLVTVGQPYSLRLPDGVQCEVAWGDGVVEKVAKNTASHTYTKPGIASINVKALGSNGKWVSLPVDYAARVQVSQPALFVGRAVKAGTTLPKVLTAPADSFSIEARVQFDNPDADQVIFASQPSAAGACQFGIRNKSLFFEVAGGGVFTAPLENRLTAGKWHHLAVTYDRVPLFPRSNQVRFYIDGRPAGDGAIDADDAGAVDCSSALVGGQGFQGQIENLAIYNNLLFPLAIWQHAQALAGDTSLTVTAALPGSTDVVVNPPVITQTVDVALDPAPAADNGPTLRKALSAAQPGTKVRLVSQTNPSQGGQFYVRSLVEQNKWAALLLENKTDVELDGNGSTLIFSDKAARYMLIDKCQRVAVRNLSFDLDPTYARVGMYAKLLEVNPETQVVKAQLVNGRDGSPDPVIPRRASYWRWRSHDPKTLRIGGGGPSFDAGSYAERPTADPQSGPGVIRFKLKQKADDKLWSQLKAFQAGANFYLINNGDFSTNSVSLMRTSHITFDHVNYYATLGMVFLSSSLDHLHITHCKIGLPPGLTAADRPLAAGADGYHFHLTQGDILCENNEITLTDDDPISIKDSIYPNIKKVGDNQLQVGEAASNKKIFDVLVDDSQTAGTKKVGSGVPIELLNPDFSPTGYLANATAAQGNILTLDKPLPAEVLDGSLMMNRSHHTKNWIIRDNYLHDYYGRVMLYTDYGTVIGNRIHRSYYHLGNSVAYFEHAGASRNVITHRNLFENTNADSSNWGGNQTIPSFHDITYSANSFLGKGLNLNNAANSLVVGNWFDGKDATVSLKSCVNTRVQGNLGFQDGLTAFALKQRDSTNVTVEGNSHEG